MPGETPPDQCQEITKAWQRYDIGCHLLLAILNGVTGAAIDLLRMIVAPQSMGNAPGTPADFINAVERIKSSVRVDYPSGASLAARQGTEVLGATLFNVALGSAFSAISGLGEAEAGVHLSRVAVAEPGGELTFIFRGDSRAPEIIFNEGFSARGSSTDLLAHAIDNTEPPSAFVSTSTSYDVAVQFNRSKVYVLRPVNGIDVNKVLGRSVRIPRNWR